MPSRADRQRGLFRRLWRYYLRPYWPRMGFATVLMVIEGSTLALLSWMLKPLFDRVFVGRDESAIWWVGGASDSDLVGERHRFPALVGFAARFLGSLFGVCRE